MKEQISIKSKPVILVADDDPRIRSTFNDLLNIEGYNVAEVSDGLELLSKINMINPDVILLDIHMPGKTGIEITEILKTDVKLMHIPIIIVTGENDIKLRIEALKLGADDFLVKPPHLAELSARLKSLVKVKAYNDYMINNQAVLEKQVSERTLELRHALTDLQNASLDTIYSLSRAAEYRDEDTSSHLQRMSNYAVALSGCIGMSQEISDMILYTSPMHDIGKIGIPDNILLKKGSLDSTEWDLMKKHTIIGAKILEGSKSLLLIKGRIIALSHHEKWDGTGYPNGLSGENIPVEGRIAAIADVFDALTTKRPYKNAFTAEKAFQIIEEGRGKHFDPDFASAFISIKDKILKIKSDFQEI